eukprot:3323224-Alexandrium_andersonii.AAC.1
MALARASCRELNQTPAPATDAPSSLSFSGDRRESVPDGPCCLRRLVVLMLACCRLWRFAAVMFSFTR